MRCLYKILIAIIFIPMMIACASGVNLREGIACFRAQDYRSAFIRLRPEAEKGQPDAQYAIGYMYYYGQGVVEDRKKAWFWITVAAKGGQPDALLARELLGSGNVRFISDER